MFGSRENYPYVRKRRNSDKILSFRTNPTKLCMLQLPIDIIEPTQPHDTISSPEKAIVRLRIRFSWCFMRCGVFRLIVGQQRRRRQPTSHRPTSKAHP